MLCDQTAWGLWHKRLRLALDMHHCIAVAIIEIAVFPTTIITQRKSAMKKFWTLIIALAFAGLVYAQTPAPAAAPATASTKTEASKTEKKPAKKAKRIKKTKKAAKEVKKDEVKAEPTPATK
jgi:hypothetical protein